MEPEEPKAETERKGHKSRSVDVVFGNSSRTRAQPHPGFWATGTWCGHTQPAPARGKRWGWRRGTAGWESLIPEAIPISPRGYRCVTIPPCPCDVPVGTALSVPLGASLAPSPQGSAQPSSSRSRCWDHPAALPTPSCPSHESSCCQTHRTASNNQKCK